LSAYRVLLNAAEVCLVARHVANTTLQSVFCNQDNRGVIDFQTSLPWSLARTWFSEVKAASNSLAKLITNCTRPRHSDGCRILFRNCSGCSWKQDS